MERHFGRHDARIWRVGYWNFVSRSEPNDGSDLLALALYRQARRTMTVQTASVGGVEAPDLRDRQIFDGREVRCHCIVDSSVLNILHCGVSEQNGKSNMESRPVVTEGRRLCGLGELLKVRDKQFRAVEGDGIVCEDAVLVQ